MIVKYIIVSIFVVFMVSLMKSFINRYLMKKRVEKEFNNMLFRFQSETCKDLVYSLVGTNYLRSVNGINQVFDLLRSQRKSAAYDALNILQEDWNKKSLRIDGY